MKVGTRLETVNDDGVDVKNSKNEPEVTLA